MSLRTVLTQQLRLPALLKRRSFWLKTATALLLGGALLCVAAGLAYVSRAEELIGAAQLECRAALTEEMPGHRARVARLGALPFFVSARPGGDAGPFLNSALPWPPTQQDLPQIKLALRSGVAPQPATRLQLPFELKSRLRKEQFELTPETMAEVSQLDVTWLADLSDFARWDIVFPATTADLDFFRDDPEFGLLHHWARVALLQGLARGDARPSAGQVRHLAWLLLTSQSFEGAFSGFALLKLEAEARAVAVRRGLPVEGWEPLDTKVKEEAAAVIWFAFLAQDEDFSTGALANEALADVPPVLACTAAGQWYLDRSMRRWLEGREFDSMNGPGCNRAYPEDRARPLAKSVRRRIGLRSLGGGAQPGAFEQFGGWAVSWFAPARAWKIYSRLETGLCSRAGITHHLERVR